MTKFTNSLPKQMRAALAMRYGGPEVIKIREVPLPVLKPDTVMVRVEASAVNSGDSRTRALQAAEPIKTLMRLVLGLKRPRRPILGTVYAGTVAATGKGVTAFNVNDKVFGDTPGMSFGCHAQYVAVPQDSAIAPMPKDADPAGIASLIFGGATALFFLEKANAAPGKKALIYGASGAVGSMAVQIAKILNMHVTGVAGSNNKELVISLGADQFFDYTKPGFRLPQAHYDLIFDAAGKLSKNLAKQSLKPGGDFTTAGGKSVSKETRQQMERLAAWYTSGLLRPVIQERLAFDQIRKAHSIADSGHKRGSVILLIDQEDYQ